MRVAGLLVLAAAAAAHAGYVEKDGEYVCEQPNASYCLGGDIILRCDAYGKGTPGRCSDNLSGYPPLGGTASCYEKPSTHGEAACEKNCVVYYAGGPYTLPAALCHPSYTTATTTSSVATLTTIYTHTVTTAKAHYNTTQAGHPVGPGQTTRPGHPGHPGHHGHHGNSTQPGQPGYTTVTATGYTTKCLTVTYPNPTQSGASKTRTITYTSPLYPPGSEPHYTHHRTHTTMSPAQSGSPPPPHVNGTCPTCHYGGHGGHGNKGISQKGEKNENGAPAVSGSETRVPVGPTSTSEPETVTGAAAVNTVSGMLAFAAVAAAYLI